jgi:hypothetical protein
MDGQLKEAYNHLNDVVHKDFDSYPMLFDMMPDLRNDKQVLTIIEQNRTQ